MPKFIGNRITGARQIEDNAELPEGCIRLNFEQAIKLPPEQVICSLDTTDRGYVGTYAKRWFRWFALATDVLNAKDSTDCMRQKALSVLQPKKAKIDDPCEYLRR